MTMKILCVAVFLVAQTAGGPTYKGQPREPHPFAPSLPKLTEKEDKDIADIVDRFIDQDIGKLKGAAGAKAIADFKTLGPEATFALLDGLNRAANMEDSCPVVLIAKRINLIIRASKDRELLEFLRENIGNDVTAKRHVNVLKDLRVGCMLRKSELQRIDIAMGGKKTPSVAPAKNKEKPPRDLSTPELITATRKEKGEALKPLLVELGSRKGEEILETLAVVANADDKANQQLAKTLLTEALGRQNTDELKQSLEKGAPPVRAAAARAIAAKGLQLVVELIAALDDAEDTVRQAARQALVQLADRQADYGPEAGATPNQRSNAQVLWKTYWQK
jgi:hypothetical protein